MQPRIPNLRWLIGAIILALLLTQVAAPLLLASVMPGTTSPISLQSSSYNDPATGHIWAIVKLRADGAKSLSWLHWLVDDAIVSSELSSTLNVHFDDKPIPFPIDRAFVTSHRYSEQLIWIRRVGVPMKWISFARVDAWFPVVQGQTPPATPMHKIGNPWPSIELLPLTLNILIVSTTVALLFRPITLLRRRHRIRTGKCLRCAYTIPVTHQGERVARCPECGTPTHYQDAPT